MKLKSVIVASLVANGEGVPQTIVAVEANANAIAVEKVTTPAIAIMMEDAPTMAIITNKDIVAKAITMVVVGNTTIIGMTTIERRVECKTMRNVLCTLI
jgi:hypothetical protein